MDWRDSNSTKKKKGLETTCKSICASSDAKI